MDIREEFEGLDLGDPRLNSRVKSSVQAIAKAPSESFPRALKGEAELEGWYRLLSNPQASYGKLLLPHQRKSAERVAQSERTVVVAHDTTEMSFSSVRQGLGRMQEEPEGKALFVHLALALELQGERRHPLGVLHAEPYVRTGKPQRKRSRHSEKKPPSQRESIRWVKGVDRVSAQLGAHRQKPIHVMDREADMYTLMSQMLDLQARFVIRGKHERAGAMEQSRSTARLQRDIELGARGPHPKSKHMSQPPRAGRKAQVEVTARSVTLPRPHTDEKHKHPPRASLTLNQVLVREVHEENVPKGQEPVEWALWTTEPIDTAEDLAHIVDVYRARWLVEEFFKALKTGCAYEQRQLESKDTLLTALAMLLPMAYQLLALRTLAEAEPEAAPTHVLSEDQVHILQTHPATQSMSIRTALEALLAIAKLGGHLKRNGPPGWLVLYRGMQELRQLEIGFQLAKSRARCDLS